MLIWKLEFYRYRTLMSIKWLKFSLRWKIGKTGVLFNASFYTMRNWWPTYKLIKILWIWRKKKQLCWQLFVSSEESSKYFGLVLVIFKIFRNREKRIGSFDNKDRGFSYKELSVRAKWIERFMFGSGRDHRHFEMNGKIIYFH